MNELKVPIVKQFLPKTLDRLVSAIAVSNANFPLPKSQNRHFRTDPVHIRWHNCFNYHLAFVQALLQLRRWKKATRARTRVRDGQELEFFFPLQPSWHKAPVRRDASAWPQKLTSEHVNWLILYTGMFSTDFLVRGLSPECQLPASTWMEKHECVDARQNSTIISSYHRCSSAIYANACHFVPNPSGWPTVLQASRTLRSGTPLSAVEWEHNTTGFRTQVRVSRFEILLSFLYSTTNA